ncbi:hypothetical protein BASA61_002774 [Batrachochytrium salamandrivorans]|nr:hypothetical protein BASA61_002774 [Batrachochytrium salamandrivorans]
MSTELPMVYLASPQTDLMTYMSNSDLECESNPVPYSMSLRTDHGANLFTIDDMQTSEDRRAYSHYAMTRRLVRNCPSINRFFCNPSNFQIKFSITSGICDLYVLKSTGSSFENYHTDRLTTLPPMAERVLSTDVTAKWTFPPSIESLQDNSAPVFTPTYNAVRQITLDLFANHDSPSVQNTLYRMGELVLTACPPCTRYYL